MFLPIFVKWFKAKVTKTMLDIPNKIKQETRAKSTQNRAMSNLSVSAVNTALWNSPLLGI